VAGQRPPHELVRAVALTNFFDRKRTLLAGEIADPEEVLRLASELEGVYFGPPLVARFLRTFGVYPPGTVVELTDHQVALVTHANPHDPLRPQVQLLSGAQATRLVDLTDRSATEGRQVLSISRAILPPLALREAPADWEGVAVSPAPEAEAAPAPPPETEAPVAEDHEPPPEPAADEEDAELILARLGGGDAVPTLVVGQAGLHTALLDHREGFLVSFIDGTCPVDSLLYATGLPRAEVLRILDRLVRAGVVRIG
jgi:hypothetical protein